MKPVTTVWGSSSPETGLMLTSCIIIIIIVYITYLIYLCTMLAPLGVTLTRNSSGDEIANVNFLYDIVHVLQNTIDSCINSATDRRGYVLERVFYQIQ